MRLIWGDDLDDALRPVLGVTLAGSAAGSATWSFMAIWAIDELGAKAELPFALLVGAILAALSGFAGGYLSDRIGRRRVILFGQAVMVGYPLLLLALTDVKWAGVVALSLAGVFGALGGSVAQAMVADLVAPERHQAAYASVRVAANVGVVIGPPIGGLLLVLG
jgi:DHA1 family multidrug resistance protein B-like MFS transporter